MGRKLKKRRYDAEQERYIVARIRDDRSKARKVQTSRQLSLFANNNGSVSNEMVQRGLVTYAGNSKVEVNQAGVKREVAQLQREIEEARFEGAEQINNQYEEEAKRQNITRRQARNLNRTEYSVRAQAVLTASNAGKVKLNSYQKGILNGLARGGYDDVVFGKEKEGRRRYEAGTFRAQLRSKRVKSRDSSVNARSRENLQYLKGQSGEAQQGGTADSKQFGSFLAQVAQNRQKRKQPPPLPRLPDNFRDIKF